MRADAAQHTIDQHPALNQQPVRDHYGVKVSSSYTMVPDREDAQCEDDDSDVVLSSDDENGECLQKTTTMTIEVGPNRPSNYRSCH